MVDGEKQEPQGVEDENLDDLEPKEGESDQVKGGGISVTDGNHGGDGG